MNTKTLVKKLRLSDQDFDDIKKAVEEAEKKTTGEITLAVTAESSHYSFWELLFSNIFAAIAIFAFLPFSNKIKELYSILYWKNEPSWILPVFFILMSFSLIIISFYITNIPFIDRLIIPDTVKKSCVTARAFQHFSQSNVYCTNEHTGILIFVSYMERQVRIIADKGISDKISQDIWNLITDEFAETLGKKDAKTAFITAIQRCGELLSENFPAHKENPNELSDGLVILEANQWN